MPRPCFGDPGLSGRAAELALASVRCWSLGAAGQPPSKAELVDAVTTAYDEVGCDDAMALAEYLETHFGWNMDDDLVGVFRSEFYQQAYEEAVAAWVRELAVRPACGVSADVSVRIGRGLTAAGEIVGIDTQQALYHVHVPALGHIRTPHGEQSLILPFEALDGFAAVAT